MRELRHHEKKLLKKVDFLQYKNENTQREVQVMRRYHVQKREDYVKYNKVVGEITRLVSLLKRLDPSDPFRAKYTEMLLNKLYAMALVPSTKGLQVADKVTVAALCRRRLPVVMFRNKMAETMRQAVTYVEQGHVRVGPDTVNDPAFMVTRNMEDFVTWTDSSAIKRKVMRYNNKLDDADLLG